MCRFLSPQYPFSTSLLSLAENPLPPPFGSGFFLVLCKNNEATASKAQKYPCYALCNAMDAHEYVQMSYVIGVPDSYKMQKVKAFVKLVACVEATEATKQAILDHCRKHIAKYAMPYDIEFKDDMPKTLVGKVAYRVLEEAELQKISS